MDANEILLWASIWILCIYCVLRDQEDDLKDMSIWAVIVRIILSPLIVIFQILEWIWWVIIQMKHH
jgi:hypothetical protein